MAQRKK
jgi:hypothetical protein